MSREVMPTGPALHVRPRPRPDDTDLRIRPDGPGPGGPAADGRTADGHLPVAAGPGRTPDTAPTTVPQSLVDQPLADPAHPHPRPGAPLGDGTPAVPPTRGHHPADLPYRAADLVADLDEAPAGATGRPVAPPVEGRRGGRWRRRAAVAVVAAGCLAVGAIGGSGWSRQQARAEAEAATRVLLWTDVTPPPERSAGDDAGDDRLRVRLMTSGVPVVVESVLLGGGRGESEGGVTLLPGRTATADLVLHPDCTTSPSAGTAADSTGGSTGGAGATTGGAGAAASPWRAVVRPVGSLRSRELPLDVPVDSAAVAAALGAGCPAGSAGAVAAGRGATAVDDLSAADPDADPAGDPAVSPGSDPGAAPVQSSAVVVGDLRASSKARLTFTLTTRGPATARFEMPVAAVGNRARFTVRTRPALPVTVRAGQRVAVTVEVSATCRSHTGTLPPTYGLLLPQALLAGSQAGSRHSDVPVEGWDDGVAASALTAAALRGCP